ncbi:STAS domain-containing protein [Streptomyces sp. NPDC006733]|uniref:STAS domain-containing protein n=1 Tax=Streptomyces sp. NPDC006733 TaxID=3155460 RepID=UPI0033F6FB67
MPPNPAFAVRIRTCGTVSTVELHGEIDLMAAPHINRRLDGLHRRGHGGHLPDLVIDLGAVTFMDCRGLSALLHARALTTAHQGRLHLTNIPPQVSKLLRLTNLTKAFPLQDARAGGVSGPCR